MLDEGITMQSEGITKSNQQLRKSNFSVGGHDVSHAKSMNATEEENHC